MKVELAAFLDMPILEPHTMTDDMDVIEVDGYGFGMKSLESANRSSTVVFDIIAN